MPKSEGRGSRRTRYNKRRRRGTTAKSGDTWRRDVWIFFKSKSMLQTRDPPPRHILVLLLWVARARTLMLKLFLGLVRSRGRSVFVFSRSSRRPCFVFAPSARSHPPFLNMRAREPRHAPCKGEGTAFVFGRDEKKRGVGGPETQRRKSAAPQKKTRGRPQGRERNEAAAAAARAQSVQTAHARPRCITPSPQNGPHAVPKPSPEKR